MNRSISLDGEALPDKWYNLQADLPSPLPPYRHPGTGEPLSPDDLAPLFPSELIKQEVSRERWIEIPETVREKLGIWETNYQLRIAYLVISEIKAAKVVAVITINSIIRRSIIL